MEEASRVFQGESTVLKAVVVGDIQAGKTAFCTQFKTNEDFNGKYNPSISVHFVVKKFQLDSQQQVSLQFWDIASIEKFSIMLPAYFKYASIFFIVIASDTSEKIKLQQIRDWLDLVQKNTVEPIKIILIETKSDLDTANPLTEQQLAEFVKKDKSFWQNEKIRCDAYMLISSKKRTHFAELEKLLVEIFYDVEPNLKRAEPINQQHIPLQIVEDDVTNVIKNLEDDQAQQLLFFVERCIRRGTENSYEKPYQLSWFSGTSYKYKFEVEALGVYLEFELNLPRHIPELLDLIKLKGTTSAKVVLCQIYFKSLEIAKSNSFARKSSTQHFYQHLLPNYYEKFLQPTTLNIYKEVNALSDEQASNIIKDIKVRLLEGAMGSNNA